MNENNQTPEAVQQGTTALPEQVTVCDIQFRSECKVYYFDPGELTIHAGDHVIIDTARGPEYGRCSTGNHLVKQSDVVQPLRKVIRLATPKDDKINESNQALEKKAYGICLQKIADLGLDMQLVSAECAFDGSKLLFFFTADGRIDFRELVKNLAAIFRTRIELRQIGVRDKAKMIGGLGICGRPFCCAQFLSDFQPVSIKMAKTQNLSLNPTKISGTCGRLMCCLKYEQEAYEELLKTSPKAESFVDTPDGRGTVTDVNLMRQSVKVRMEKDPEEVHTYRNCDICVLRNGKAKKTDPPIPEDLAPISGNLTKTVQDSFPRFSRRAAPSAPVTAPLTTDPEATTAKEDKKPARSRNTFRNTTYRNPAPSGGKDSGKPQQSHDYRRKSTAQGKKPTSPQEGQAAAPGPNSKYKKRHGGSRYRGGKKNQKPESGS